MNDGALRPIRWMWDGPDCPVHDGFTDGKSWNGFPHVRVTPEVYAKITVGLCDGDWEDIEIGEDGLYDLQGLCTVEATDEDEVAS